MKDLQCLRKEIDKVNEQMLQLFVKRLEISEEIGEYKRKNGIPLFDSNREEEIIKKALENENEKYHGVIEKFLKTLMDTSKEVQKGNDSDE